MRKSPRLGLQTLVPSPREAMARARAPRRNQRAQQRCRPSSPRLAPALGSRTALARFLCAPSPEQPLARNSARARRRRGSISGGGGGFLQGCSDPRDRISMTRVWRQRRRRCGVLAAVPAVAHARPPSAAQQVNIERCREISNIHDELLARSAPAFAASISPTSRFSLFWSLRLVASVGLTKG